jgi:hypothetical protein
MRDSERLLMQRQLIQQACARTEAAKNADDHVIRENLYYHAAIDVLKVMVSMDPIEE